MPDGGTHGRWRRGKVVRLTGSERSVGPQNVNLDGSNYRGARGASLNDIHRMTKAAIDQGAGTLWIGTLIRRTSLDRGFRWISHSGRDAREFLEQIEDAMRRRESVDVFADRIHNADFPVKGAITWSIIGY